MTQTKTYMEDKTITKVDDYENGEYGLSTKGATFSVPESFGKNIKVGDIVKFEEGNHSDVYSVTAPNGDIYHTSRNKISFACPICEEPHDGGILERNVSKTVSKTERVGYIVKCPGCDLSIFVYPAGENNNAIYPIPS